MRINLSTAHAAAVLTALLFMPSCKKEEARPTGGGGGGGGTGLPPPYLNPDLTYGTVTDQDGNSYRTIQIVDQVWMAQNLRTTTYANGDTIPNVTDNTAWAQLTTGAWAHYENNASYENPYGKLYNWYAVADPRNVCPTNWHVPNYDEWEVLSDYLGGESVAGGKMKSTGTQYWLSPNTGATNESGFSGLPGGGGGYDFDFLGSFGRWWSRSQTGPESAASRRLNYTDAAIEWDIYDNQRVGYCVRCVRD